MQTLRRTPLYEQHVEAGARLVPFAGWEMPVQYEGVIPEHKAVRTDAGLFDVSHMGEIEVEGPKAQELLQHLLSNDVSKLEPGEAQYTLLPERGGGRDRRPDRLPPGQAPLPAGLSMRSCRSRGGRCRFSTTASSRSTAPCGRTPGVFDVSHMGELEVEGMHAPAVLQSALSNDISKLGIGDAQYTLLTNERGGIIDDLIVYRPRRVALPADRQRLEPRGRLRWLKEREVPGSDVRDVSDEYALLAVQGPRSLERLGLAEGKPFTWEMGEIDGVEVMINRTGYTGETGVELMCPAEDAPALGRGRCPRREAVRARRARHAAARGLLPAARQRHLAGHRRDLGRPRLDVRARHGVHRRRRAAADQGAGAGAEARRVRDGGEGDPAAGMPIEGGGEVTSGSHSPMLDVGIGMGYVPAATAEPDTEITIDVRGRPRGARIVKKPIYKKE